MNQDREADGSEEEGDEAIAPPLRYYRENRLSRKTLNRLPHWQQERAAYFITFRLADSVPQHLTKNWHEDRETWIRLNPKPWSEDQEQEYHERFSLRMERLLDAGHGACVLRYPENSSWVVDALRFKEGDAYHLHAWVVMPNHVHVLMSLAEGSKLEKVIAGWKRWASNRIQQKSETRGGIWQKDYFDRMIRDHAHFQRVIRYIRNNPVKAGLREDEYALFVEEGR
jgi:REP element-mobilizing transposase RayT